MKIFVSTCETSYFYDGLTKPKKNKIESFYAIIFQYDQEHFVCFNSKKLKCRPKILRKIVCLGKRTK